VLCCTPISWKLRPRNLIMAAFNIRGQAIFKHALTGRLKVWSVIRRSTDSYRRDECEPERTALNLRSADDEGTG